MRSLLFVLTLAMPTLAFTAQSVSGFIVRSGSDIYVSSSDSCENYKIQATATATIAAVSRLSTGDALTATGTYDQDSCTVSIDSVDYVGLKRMLGNWFSKEGIFQVRDFNTMSFFAFDGSNSQTLDEVAPTEYKYSVTPAQGNQWVLFLSNCTSTTFATIEFARGQAIMKIYDSDTGDLTKTFYLIKKDL